MTFTQEGSAPVRLPPSTVLQLPPLSRGRLQAAGALCYGIWLDAAAWQTLQSLGQLRAEPVFAVTLSPYLQERLPHLVRQLRDTPQSALFEAYLSLQRFLIHLHRAAVQNAQKKREAILQRAGQLLWKGSTQPHFQVESVAQAVGMSYENFRKVFRAAMGCSPHQYLLDRRFDWACQLLRTGRTVSETAAAVGYDEPYTFSRQFHRHVGMPPSENRRRHRAWLRPSDKADGEA